jgi:protein-S-isoprenylcysteine O-methyltransferase Ste14
MIWLRTLLFAFVIVVPVLAVLPLWLVGARRGEIGPAPLAVAGGVLTAAGIALMLWCWRDFAVRGGGTPAPVDAPRRLVVSGPYRHVRNPMYLAGITILLGEAALFRAPVLLAYAAAFLGLTHAFVVFYEERALLGRFGSEYQSYRAAVPRWIPCRKPWINSTAPSAE